MRRRLFGPTWFLTVCAALASMGCESLRSSTRKHADDAKAEAVDPDEAEDSHRDKVLAVDSDPKNPTPFFKNSRKSGALSDEGRDIERSLGVK